MRERIANKRRELAEEQEARKRKEMEEQEEKERGEGVDDSGGAKKSDMETELAAVRTDEQDHQQYFRDAYVLTMSQRTVAVPVDAADEQSSQFDVSMLESGVFESFVEMEQMDITTVVKESNRPLVFIQTFKSETNGLGSLDRTLEQIRPRYIVMYHTNVTAIRQIEVYEARQQRQEMARVRVYAIIHSKTVEEQSYLTSLRREKQAFELLIETKRVRKAITITVRMNYVKKLCILSLSLPHTHSDHGCAGVPGRQVGGHDHDAAEEAGNFESAGWRTGSKGPGRNRNTARNCRYARVPFRSALSHPPTRD